MNSVRFARKALMVATVFAAASNVVFAQEAGAAAGPVLHYFGAALGLGMIVIGAALGIGRFASPQRRASRASRRRRRRLRAQSTCRSSCSKASRFLRKCSCC